jgi:hypothetical protein
LLLRGPAAQVPVLARVWVLSCADGGASPWHTPPPPPPSAPADL